MKRFPTVVFAAFAFGFMAALMTVSGCSEAASRTMTIFQFQSTKTYSGPFRIDTSQLPSNAIVTQSETGGPGKPETRLKLSMDYEFEIVLRLAGTKANGMPQSAAKPQKDTGRD
jgi:hypothetical protein